jgi:uncharacterized membrane protein YkvI
MKKTSMSAIFALAFVWFTTHFGGGFASGRQVVEYFIGFGWYAVFMPILSQLIVAVVLYYAWKFALEKKVFNYRDWTNEFYKPVQGIMSNVYEVLYNLTLMTATAVAFATGAATLEKVFDTPYILNTIVIALSLFFLTIFGADLVRKAATVIAVAIIAGVVIIYVPNIAVSFSKITSNISGLKNGTIPNDASFFNALLKTLLYAGFQAVALGAYLAHADVLKDKNEVKRASIVGFIINSGILMLAVLGILAYYNDGILTEAIPALFVIKNGVGSSWMMPLVSILIILGAISTGVTLIYGISQRIVLLLGKNESKEVFKQKERKRSIVASIVYVAITWSIAQFGLIPLVAKGYGTLGYVSLFVIVIPLILKGILQKGIKEEQSESIGA